jgi:hypothetical protein
MATELGQQGGLHCQAARADLAENKLVCKRLQV